MTQDAQILDDEEEERERKIWERIGSTPPDAASLHEHHEQHEHTSAALKDEVSSVRGATQR